MQFEGSDLNQRPKTREETLKRRQIQMVFPDPYSSLNPRMRVGKIVAESILVNGLAKSKSEAYEIAQELLELVKLNGSAARRYPHAFFGGQRQRISVARALASRLRLLICDEPTSALDVSIQAKILILLKGLQDRLNLSMLFISHDLPVMRQMCDEIAVMRFGEIVEQGPAASIFTSPQHKYTQDLISLMPKFEQLS